MFLFGFGAASVAKAQQKMSNPCTSKSRNLELHFTMSVFLLAASLDFQLYWRVLPSFPEFIIFPNCGIGGSGSCRSTALSGQQVIPLSGAYGSCQKERPASRALLIYIITVATRMNAQARLLHIWECPSK